MRRSSHTNLSHTVAFLPYGTAHISLIIVLAVVGLIWYLVTTYIPMPPPIRVVVTVVFVVILCIWLLEFLGGSGSLVVL